MSFRDQCVDQAAVPKPPLHESPLPVPKMQSVFHLHAQCNASHRNDPRGVDLISDVLDSVGCGHDTPVSCRMRAHHGANPKGSKEGQRMNDTQTLVLIHTVAWPILIWALSKTWSSSRNAVRFSSTRTMKRPLL